MLLCASSVWASPVQEIRVGVLAFREVQSTQTAWQPTIDYLNSQIPEYHFTLQAMYFPDMDKAVREKRVDFLLTNPGRYIVLQAEFGIEAVATLIRLQSGHPVNKFGSVIFTRADRSDINKFSDLPGKTLVAVSEQSFGGFLIPRWALLRGGVSIKQFDKVHYVGMPQDRVVHEVLGGTADVGFVRTGVLEGMIRENKIQAGQIKVINPQSKEVFPEMLSTDLYPEWPMAVMPHVAESLGKQVARALQDIQANDYAARAGGYYGFSEPGEYASVEAVILRLQMEPDADGSLDWRDIYRRYPKVTLGGLVGMSLGLWLGVLYFWRTNRQMRRHQLERDRLSLHLQIANNTLEEKIVQRTEQIQTLQSNLQRMLDSMAEGMYGVDTQGCCTFVNAAFLRMLGFERADEVIGKHIHELIHYAYPDGTPYPSTSCRMYLAYMARQEVNVDDEVFWRKDGTPLAVEYWSHPIVENGEVIGAVATFLDITERKKAESVRLRNQVVVETAQDGFWMVDMQGRLLEVNQAYERMSGYCRDMLLQMHISQLEAIEKSPAAVQAHMERIVSQGFDHFETRHRRQDGREVDMEVSVTFEPQLRLFFAFSRDISERKKTEKAIHQLAFYDTLTGLPNRRLLLDRLQNALAVSARNQRHGAVMFLDLDRFKILNDTQGHDVGDLLLIEVARRLQASTRDIDVVSRIGGDEFVVVLEMLEDDAQEAARQASQVAENIRETLAQPYQLRKHVHYTSPSIGVVLFQGLAHSVETLLKHADTAMYQAKNAGRNAVRFFDPALQAELQARIQLEQALHLALTQREFRLFYQVQVDLQGRLVGAEALLRWAQPGQALQTPQTFITLLEESGLVVPVGLWALRTACEQLMRWQACPEMRHLTLAVNVSARQFREIDFVPQLQQILATTGAPARRLQLELTEGTVLADVEETIAKMKQLRRMGISLSMDDFGTGYSSLHYLKRLPLDQVKIDRAFVRDIATDPNDAAIVEAIIAICHALDLHVIAEGVEDTAQLDFLKQHGCHAFQGYLFGSPVVEDALLAHLTISQSRWAAYFL